MLAFVVGLFLQEALEATRQGFLNYFSKWWNVVDALIVITFLLSYTVWLSAWGYYGEWKPRKSAFIVADAIYASASVMAFFPPSSRFPDQFSVGSFTAVALQNAERCAEVSCNFSAPVHCVCYWGGQDILVLCCFADQTKRIERQPRLQAVSSLWKVRITKDILLNRMTVSTEQNRPFETKTIAGQAWLVEVSLF